MMAPPLLAAASTAAARAEGGARELFSGTLQLAFALRRDSPLGPSTMLLDRVALGEQHGSGSYFCMKNLVRHSSEAWSCGAEDLSRAAMRS